MNELLMSILKCGYRDLEKLNVVLGIADELDLNIDNIMKYTEEINEGKINFNALMYSAMQLIINEIADRISEEYEDGEIANKLRDNFNPYVNYMDSWFNIEALDSWDSEDDISKNIKRVYEEVKGW